MWFVVFKMASRWNDDLDELMWTTTPVSVINVTHIICEQCFYTSLSVINVNNLNSALTLLHA
jgi:hypothetical protein